MEVKINLWSSQYGFWCWAVHYEGVLAENGEVFDTTREDNTVFSFEVGKGTVIKAWDVALKTMKVKTIDSWWNSFEHIGSSFYYIFGVWFAGWGSCKNHLHARICLRKRRFSARYPTKVIPLYFLSFKIA